MNKLSLKQDYECFMTIFILNSGKLKKNIKNKIHIFLILMF